MIRSLQLLIRNEISKIRGKSFGLPDEVGRPCSEGESANKRVWDDSIRNSGTPIGDAMILRNVTAKSLIEGEKSHTSHTQKGDEV